MNNPDVAGAIEELEALAKTLSSGVAESPGVPSKSVIIYGETCARYAAGLERLCAIARRAGDVERENDTLRKALADDSPIAEETRQTLRFLEEATNKWLEAREALLKIARLPMAQSPNAQMIACDALGPNGIDTMPQREPRRLVNPLPAPPNNGET